MLRGLYAITSSMMADTVRQDIVSNNLANASTPGFKRDLARFQSFSQLLLSASDVNTGPMGTLSLGSLPMGTYVDLTPGSIRVTGNPSDAAIKGDGFFVVETPDGKAYTRDGSFVRGDGNYLTTAKGHPVMGQSGKIALTAGAVAIDRDGTVRVNNTTVGKLQVVKFADEVSFTKDRDGYFLADSSAPQTVSTPEIESGSLEWSNVNPIMEMVNLITVMRSYEATVKSLTSQDSTLEKAVNEIAR